MIEDTSWHKSSYSGGNANACVEVAETARAARVRDTQSRDLGYLSFPVAEWASFLHEVKSRQL